MSLPSLESINRCEPADTPRGRGVTEARLVTSYVRLHCKVHHPARGPNTFVQAKETGLLGWLSRYENM